jgi:hypothetical protein
MNYGTDRRIQRVDTTGDDRGGFGATYRGRRRDGQQPRHRRHDHRRPQRAFVHARQADNHVAGEATAFVEMNRTAGEPGRPRPGSPGK